MILCWVLFTWALVLYTFCFCVRQRNEMKFQRNERKILTYSENYVQSSIRNRCDKKRLEIDSLSFFIEWFHCRCSLNFEWNFSVLVFAFSINWTWFWKLGSIRFGGFERIWKNWLDSGWNSLYKFRLRKVRTEIEILFISIVLIIHLRT